jgi:acetyl-CoA acyltransferase
MKNVVIVESKRTAIGKAYKGSLANTRPDTLGAMLLNKMLVKSNIKREDIGDLIIGCAMPEGEQGMNMAKTIGTLASLPNEVPALTVNRFCASGLQAINNIAQAIEVGNIDLGVAGGVESMSMVPMGGYRFSANSSMVENDIDFYTSMGITAENVASKFNISRQRQDEFACESHRRALAAINNNTFDDEIEAVEVFKYNKHDKKTFVFAQDDGPRETSVEKLGKLRASFKKDGSVTAGNASQMSDGAAFSFLCNETYAKENNLKPLGYFRDFSVVGVPPNIMGIGPIPAIQSLLKKSNLDIGDIDLFEINEAFAAQAVYCVDKLKIDKKIVNVHGGAIAQGHPLGCTGARQTATLLHEMKRRKARYGIVSMCIGGGMGAAALFEAAY